MTGRYLKRMVAFMLIGIMSLSVSMPASAVVPSESPVWKQNEQGWWLENADGSYFRNTWYPYNGLWYYLGSDGYMLTNTVTPDGFLVGADGAWISGTVNGSYSAITAHTVSRDDFSRNTNNGRRLNCYFDRVIFEGADSSIDWINAQVGNIETQFINDYVSIIPDYLSKLQNSSYPGSYDIAPHQLVSVYYDASYVSIGWEVGWCAGGVNDDSYLGLNLDVANRSPLSLSDVLGENAYDKIIYALNSQGIFDDASRWIKRSVLDDMDFYFDADTVYVNIDPGLFGRTGGALTITLPR